MSALKSATDVNRMPPVAEEIEEPVEVQYVDEKRRDHQHQKKHHHHHHRSHRRTAGGDGGSPIETQIPQGNLNGSTGIVFQSNAVIMPAVQPHQIPSPAHRQHQSYARGSRAPAVVIREQYWVCSCRPLRCSNWSRCEKIMFVLLICLGTLIAGLVFVFTASLKQSD